MEGPRAFAGKSRPQSLKSLKLANLKKGTPVIIHLSGHLKPFSGGEVEIVLNGEFTTVDEAFRALLTTHAALRDRVLTEIGDIRQNVNVFVGSNDVKRLKGLQTAMRGNEIHIFNAISGG